MKNDVCSSDLLAEKIQHLSSLIQLIRRTLDSNEASIYIREAVDSLGAAGNLTQECEILRRKMDADLYQQNSKYYDFFRQE